ncbi:hypothetical protein SISSUDRAFT_1014451 [Sistotremastrum suecicum HHB10207 ss-3]|uniref:F-box domain-containing protein n=1 Tax=Sistotremastrum suecicum HHB10207 ss-3 TaxID=1314776 RepID=A0A166I647_9AGAM|nr:hypothetical protein SISSUDRAFT_1014451 [Sistotremastrum suecicum HHB10207 ss-3]
MGTRGYKAWRHKGKYIVRFNRYDSYPSHLGLALLRLVPRRKDEFERWLVVQRSILDEELGNLKDVVKNDGDEAFLSDKMPTNDLMIEWTYCIDLDRLVFHVDGMPLFDLQNLPTESEFMKFISFDFYGHRAFDYDTPEENRYKWKALPPPIDESALAAYNGCPHRDVPQPIHEILGVSETLGEREQIRVQLLQVLVGNVLRGWAMGCMMTELETLSVAEHISKEIRTLAQDIVYFATGPMFAPKETHRYDEVFDHSYTFFNGVHRYWDNLLVCVTLHLDDERNRKAAISKLVAAAVQRSQRTDRKPEGSAYGIAVSMFHIVIVKIDNKTGSFQYTDALQFFPSRYATSPCTPGITALARLGDVCVPDDDVVNIACSLYSPIVEELLDYIPEPLPETHKIHRIPLEIWIEIALHLPPTDLGHLAVSAPTPQAVLASRQVLRFPHLGDIRLDKALPSVKFRRRTSNRTQPYESLHCASFVVDSPEGEIMKVGPVQGAAAKKSADSRVGLAELDVLTHSRAPKKKPYSRRAYPYGVVAGSTVGAYMERLRQDDARGEDEESD